MSYTREYLWWLPFRQPSMLVVSPFRFSLPVIGSPYDGMMTQGQYATHLYSSSRMWFVVAQFGRDKYIYIVFSVNFSFSASFHRILSWGFRYLAIACWFRILRFSFWARQKSTVISVFDLPRIRQPIASARNNVCGIWRTDVPMKPNKISFRSKIGTDVASASESDPISHFHAAK